MGCMNSKTKKKKSKERDTLSKEGARETAKEQQEAAENELLSRQNTSALQVAGMQARDGADAASSPAPQDSDALEVPVPAQAGTHDVAVIDGNGTPSEKLVDTTAKPAATLEAQAKNSSNAVRGHRAFSNSIETAQTDSHATSQSSATNADDRKGKRGKKDKDDSGHRHHRGRAGESVSESASVSRSLTRSEEKKRNRRKADKAEVNSKKKKQQKRRSKSSSSQSEVTSTSDEERSNPAPSSQQQKQARSNLIAFDKEVSPSAQSHPQTRRTSNSQSSISFDFQSDATPSAASPAPQQLRPLQQWSPRAGVDDGNDGSVVVSSSPASVGEASRRSLAGQVQSSHPASVHSVSAHNSRALDDAGRTPVDVTAAATSPLAVSADAFRVPASVSSANTSRMPYEPYTDFGPRDGDAELPPYEWVPRTMPVPSPLRQSGAYAEGTYSVSERVRDGPNTLARDDARAAVGYGGYGNEAYGDPVMVSSSAYRDEAGTAALPPSSVHFCDPTGEVAGADEDESAAADAVPLEPRTFYPHLPPVQWPSYNTASPQPAPLSYNRYSNTPVDNLNYRNEDAVDEEMDTYDDTHALYSPADAVAEARDAAQLRRPVPPSLIDAYISDNDETNVPLRQHRGTAFEDDYYNNTNYRTAPLPLAKATALPSAYAYEPFPMLTAASVTSTEDNGIDGGFTRQGGFSRGGGVSAHQYKPVTYLFDNSMDNWMQTRRMAAPQRQLYADAADLW